MEGLVRTRMRPILFLMGEGGLGPSLWQARLRIAAGLGLLLGGGPSLSKEKVSLDDSSISVFSESVQLMMCDSREICSDEDLGLQGLFQPDEMVLGGLDIDGPGIGLGGVIGPKNSIGHEVDLG